MRFDSDEYLRDFYEKGKYPKIHDDIYTLDHHVRGLNVIDLGCCTGLLSRRLAESHPLVVGIEAKRKYLAKAVKHENIRYVNLKINFDTLRDLERIILKYNVKCVFARRVFPELWETGGVELVDRVKTLFYRCGIEYIVLEGRKSNSNATNPLRDADTEAFWLEREYKAIETYKNCVVMKRMVLHEY